MAFSDLFRARKTGKQAEPPASQQPVQVAAPQPSASETYARALGLHQQGKPEQAIPLYDLVIVQQPANAEAHYKRANALNALGRHEAALSGYDAAIALHPGYANALCNRGAVLERLGRWEEALESYDRALVLNESDYIARFNRAAVLRHFRRFDAALTDYDRAIMLRGDYPEAHVNRGHLLQEMDRDAEAVAAYERAIAIRPQLADAFDRRAVSLARLRRLREALDSYDRAIALNPASAAVHVNRGKLLHDMQCFEEALASYDEAIRLDPKSAHALRNRASALAKLKSSAAAIENYDRALALQPDLPNLLGASRFARMQVCDWSALDADLQRIRAALLAEQATCMPLQAVALFDEPQLHSLAARVWVRDTCPADDALGPIQPRAPGDRIRVGYFSADFRSHPVSLLAAGMFETHDRSRFETSAFAFGPVAAADPVRERLKGAFERFIDVDERSDREVASLARELGIDIAVDLGGFTENSRSGIFALRAAPVQLGYLGYPGTSDAPYMDYLMADRILVPQGSERYYSEKIIYLPDSYQANDSKREISTREFTRAELGLPASGVVFCCFNRYFKLGPGTFDSWMRILRSVPGSVLWLTAAETLVVTNLRAAAQRQDVDPERLIFAKRLPSVADHLARQRAADLFLDTLPFNAHTTASDALAAGLPVLTCAGHTLAGRVAASLLHAVGLPELVTNSPGEYEALAVRLATHPQELRSLRLKLLAQRASAPLFDTERFTRVFEAALTRVYERSRAGLSPEHVLVP
jgi:predicted O-linked N-acetylglucosamine transferase (SPINDLY family)